MKQALIPLLGLSTLLLGACESKFCYGRACVIITQEELEGLSGDVDFGEYTLRPTMAEGDKVDPPAYASLSASVDEKTTASFNLAYSAERGGYVLTAPWAFNAWVTANAGAGVDVDLLGLDDAGILGLAFVDGGGDQIFAWDLD